MEKDDSQDIVLTEGDNMEISKQICLEGEKFITMQTVDICDLTFSSFNDILLGDNSYFDVISIENPSDVTEKQSQKSSVTSIPDSAQSGKSTDSNRQKVDNLIKSDNYNFYHVFEVIENPVIQEKDIQMQTIKSVKCSRHKSTRHKNKRKVMTSAIRKGQRYLPNFKQKVLDYASNHTFKATALHFNINCNTITEWMRERKRLSTQQKSTTSMPDSVCQYKTEIVHTPDIKTDIINSNDRFTPETEFSDNILKNIKEDLPIGDMGSDERFLEWIKRKRNEKRELTRDEVFQAAKYCQKLFKSSTDQPIWFGLWLKRYDKALYSSKKPDNETEKYIMYPNNFKIEVALYAKTFTKNSAARVFNVPRRRIFDWFKYSHCLNVNDSFNSSNSASDVDRDMKKDKTKRQIYAELHKWYQERFEEGFCPNSNEIKAKAKELFRANGIGDIKFSEGWLQKFCKRLNIKLRHNGDDHLLLWILAQFDNNVSLSHQEITEKSSMLIGKRKEFKGSKGWTLRFLKRHSKFLQQVPKIDDKLPEIVQNEINKFCSSFKIAQESQKVHSSSIGCMDEIPISFNYPQDGKSVNLPLLRKTGFENCQAIVFLSMMADGRLLPPAVVLRGTGPRQVLSSGDVDILVLYQDKGVVDCDVLESWIDVIWLSCVSQPSILIVDSFKPHTSTKLRERLARENSVLSVIPQGCSSRLQPLDIEITPTFKEMIRNQWKELPTNEASRKCRVPDQETIMHWIRSAYRKVESNSYSIINSFKIVGFID